MAEQMRPASKKQAPKPTRCYERSNPKDEATAGKMGPSAAGTPVNRPDQAEEAVSNRRKPKELEQSP
jgi:hypothetical protein